MTTPVSASPSSTAPRIWVAGPLFFVSGAAALVLETLWVRVFALSFGTTGLAMATVLTAYMAGLALGGALGGRLADRVASPRRLVAAYGTMETVIALFALFMPLLRAASTRADVLFESLAEGSLFGLSLGRFLIAVIIMLLPTTLMGATLPVLARAIIEPDDRDRRMARQAGTLYALNTAGAVLGAAVTPFLLLPAFGVTGTSSFVASADLLVAIAALVVARTSLIGSSRRPIEPSRSASRAPATSQSAPREHHDRATARAAMIGIAASGAIAMVYQQVWARYLSLVIGSSIYAISMILAVFLLGLALGSAVYSRRTASRPGQASNIAVVHLVIVLWTAATLWIGDWLPAAFVVGMRLLGVEMTTVLLLQLAVATAVVVVPTFFMGMTFPATLRLVELGRPYLGTGRAVGSTYSWNTVGSIIGSFLGGFVVLPWLGIQAALVGCAVASLVLAIAYAGLSAVVAGRRTLLSLGSAAIVAAVALGLADRPWNLAVVSSGVFRVSRTAELARLLEDVAPIEGEARTDHLPLSAWIEAAQASLEPADLWNDGLGVERRPRMLTHRAGLVATVAVTESRSRSMLPERDWITYSLRVNGKADASLTVLEGVPPDDRRAISPQGDAETQVLSGVLPMLIHPGDPSSILVIGWGSGMTAGAALATGADSVRVVELEREVVRGSEPFQPYAGRPLDDRRLELIEDDGRRLLSARQDRYDIIVSEPSNPWISGCSNLFTKEFFELVASRLNRGGRFLQWVQAYEISPTTFVSILAALRSVFESVAIFQPAHSPSDLLIVAGQDRVQIDWERVAQRLDDPRLRRWLTPFGLVGPEDVVARLVLDTPLLAPLIEGVTPNSDDNLLVELAAPLDLVRYRESSARRLLARFDAPETPPLAPVVEPPDDLDERLSSALLRAGREPEPFRPPSHVLDALTRGAPPRRRALLEREEGSVETLAAVAATLDLESDRAQGYAILGLAAARWGEWHLSALFLTAHRALSAEPMEEAIDVLAYLCWDAGLPALASEVLSGASSKTLVRPGWSARRSSWSPILDDTPASPAVRSVISAVHPAPELNDPFLGGPSPSLEGGAWRGDEDSADTSGSRLTP